VSHCTSPPLSFLFLLFRDSLIYSLLSFMFQIVNMIFFIVLWVCCAFTKVLQYIIVEFTLCHSPLPPSPITLNFLKWVLSWKSQTHPKELKGNGRLIICHHKRKRS
jgi:hypothetical protein